jgi:hypothetical protein
MINIPNTPSCERAIFEEVWGKKAGEKVSCEKKVGAEI